MSSSLNNNNTSLNLKCRRSSYLDTLPDEMIYIIITFLGPHGLAFIRPGKVRTRSRIAKIYIKYLNDINKGYVDAFKWTKPENLKFLIRKVGTCSMTYWYYMVPTFESNENFKLSLEDHDRNTKCILYVETKRESNEIRYKLDKIDYVLLYGHEHDDFCLIFKDDTNEFIEIEDVQVPSDDGETDIIRYLWYSRDWKEFWTGLSIKTRRDIFILNGYEKSLYLLKEYRELMMKSDEK